MAAATESAGLALLPTSSLRFVKTKRRRFWGMKFAGCVSEDMPDAGSSSKLVEYGFGHALLRQMS